MVEGGCRRRLELRGLGRSSDRFLRIRQGGRIRAGELLAMPEACGWVMEDASSRGWEESVIRMMDG